MFKFILLCKFVFLKLIYLKIKIILIIYTLFEKTAKISKSYIKNILNVVLSLLLFYIKYVCNYGTFKIQTGDG